MHRAEVINRFLDVLDAGTYLEIGVAWGESFHAVRARLKLAVDPRFRFRIPLRARAVRIAGLGRGEHYFRMESDAFFVRHGEWLRAHPIDVALVDGLHESDQAMRDIENCLRFLSPTGVVLVHDCNPQTASAAAPTLGEASRTEGWNGEWNGDVYRAIVCLRLKHPDVGVCVLDMDQGLGIVAPWLEPEPLARIDDEVGSLDFESFSERREELLNLRPPEDLDRIVALHPGASPNV